MKYSLIKEYVKEIGCTFNRIIYEEEQTITIDGQRISIAKEQTGGLVKDAKILENENLKLFFIDSKTIIREDTVLEGTVVLIESKIYRSKIKDTLMRGQMCSYSTVENSVLTSSYGKPNKSTINNCKIIGVHASDSTMTDVEITNSGIARSKIFASNYIEKDKAKYNRINAGNSVLHLSRAYESNFYNCRISDLSIVNSSFIDVQMPHYFDDIVTSDWATADIVKKISISVIKDAVVDSNYDIIIAMPVTTIAPDTIIPVFYMSEDFCWYVSKHNVVQSFYSYCSCPNENNDTIENMLVHYMQPKNSLQKNEKIIEEIFLNTKRKDWIRIYSHAVFFSLAEVYPKLNEKEKLIIGKKILDTTKLNIKTKEITCVPIFFDMATPSWVTYDEEHLKEFLII